MSHITAAENTGIPAYFTLGQPGYDIERKHLDSGDEIRIATRGGDEFSGGSPLEVLGLILMRQTRGAGWKAAEDEIDSYLQEFYPDALPADEG